MMRYKRKAIYFSCLLVLILIITSCGPLTSNEQNVDVDKIDKIEKTEKREETDKTEEIEKTDDTDETEIIIPTAFDKDVEYLKGKGLNLPNLSSDTTLEMEQFLSLLVETYEALGPNIDISRFNPRSEYSNELKKLFTIGAYDVYFNYDDIANQNLDYAYTGHLLLKLQDSIQERLYWTSDYTARVDDLLGRINLINALYTWEDNNDAVKVYSLNDLLDGPIDENHKLDRLLIAEMMVTAYEDIVSEIPLMNPWNLRILIIFMP